MNKKNKNTIIDAIKIMFTTDFNIFATSYSQSREKLIVIDNKR